MRQYKRRLRQSYFELYGEIKNVLKSTKMEDRSYVLDEAAECCCNLVKSIDELKREIPIECMMCTHMNKTPCSRCEIKDKLDEAFRHCLIYL